jgi:hypothetical protein
MASPRKSLLAGPKINGRHATVIQAARPFVIAAKLRPEVTRVVIGIITKRSLFGPLRLSFSPVPSGLKVKVLGGKMAQEFYVYTKTPAATESALRAEF